MSKKIKINKNKRNKYKTSKNIIIMSSTIILGILLIGILAGGVVLDLVHQGKIQWKPILCCYNWLRNIALAIGLHYSTAFQLLWDNIGILISVLSLIFTVRENISNRYEKKIYGLLQSEMEQSRTQECYAKIRYIIYAFPFMIILFLNLEFCIAGYMVLLENFVFFYVEFWILSKSFNREKNEDRVVRTLVYCIKDEYRHGQEQSLRKYQTLLYDVKRGIYETEGWQGAENLYDKFIRELKTTDIQESFICSFYFVKIVLCNKEHQSDDSLMRCLKRYIAELYMYDIHEEKEHEQSIIILWAILYCIIGIWDANTMDGFLKWFLDFTNRSTAVRKQIGENIYTIQAEQSAVVLLALESWLSQYPLDKIYFEENIATLWKYGKRIFAKGNNIDRFMQSCVNCCINCLKYEEQEVSKHLLNLTEDSRKNRGRSMIGCIAMRQEKI